MSRDLQKFTFVSFKYRPRWQKSDYNNNIPMPQVLGPTLTHEFHILKALLMRSLCKRRADTIFFLNLKCIFECPHFVNCAFAKLFINSTELYEFNCYNS